MSNLTLTQRKDLSITGIKKVKSTQPELVVAHLADGSIIISGTNLSVQRLDLKEGLLEITGSINAIKYSNQISKSFNFKNIFK